MKNTVKLTSLMAGITSAITFTACSSTQLVSAASTGSQTENPPVVQTQQGLLQGVYSSDNSVEIFAGVPFAKPPVGALRWTEPQDPESWQGIRNADTYAPKAMQNKNAWWYDFIANNFVYHTKGGDISDHAPASEDCLYLNIWRPVEADAAETGTTETAEKLPVLVYFHGGSLTTGCSYWREYTGENLCKDGIIVVTAAYRLGVFGYFAHPDLASESSHNTTGNYGLLDQIKALEWVNANIEAFGGDSTNITIAGESAGSSSISALCATPLAKGLFRRAIGESSSLVQPVPPHTYRTLEEAEKTGQSIMQEFNCSSIEELRAIPAEKLVKTKYSNSSMTTDGYALPETPWELNLKNGTNEEALLNGFNLQDGDLFTVFTKVNRKTYPELLKNIFGEHWQEAYSLYPSSTDKEAKAAYKKIATALFFAYPHYNWTRMEVRNGKPVWEYTFTMENRYLSGNHSGELIYAYRNVPETKYFTSSDYQLESIMSTMWVNFVKYGNPNGQNLPQWDQFSTASKVMNFNQSPEMQEDPYLEIYRILDKVKLPENFQF